MNQLTQDEKRVIRDKGTERAFTGEYWNLFKDGMYVCRQCGLPLFDAKAKFEAGCGWPSFDESYPYAVKELLDADGERIEIQCARCGGHLGHVFKGEQLTEKDTRHCANSLSLKFIPRQDETEYRKTKVATVDPQEIVLGGGCFWCIEAAFLRMPGILDAVSGYAGGETENPDYESVVSGTTGHAEVVKIMYDAKTLSLEKVLQTFFLIHDPTTKDRQGNDVGAQYRSVIFYQHEEEEKKIQEYINDLQKQFRNPIVTEVLPLQKFYKAEPYHQRYFEKNPYAGYCQIVVRPKIEKVEHLVSKRELT